MYTVHNELHVLLLTHLPDIPLPTLEGKRKLLDINLRSVEIDRSVDLPSLVSLLDENYSGADIANVCRDACMMPMRRLVAGKTPEEIKTLTVEQIHSPVAMQDFEAAISKTSSSVCLADLRKYERWNKEFGAN